MDLIQWFAAPLQNEFMVKAILVSALVGVVCSALSCYVTLKGWALMGDAVSHAVMPGVVIAYVLNISDRGICVWGRLGHCYWVYSIKNSS